MTSLSVIIPTYNSERTLRLVLESVKEIADEIIIIDGGSKDRTLQIAKEYGCKIILTNLRRFDKIRNLGIRYATSEYILSLDSDDYVTRACRQEIKKVLKKPLYKVYAIPRAWIIKGKTFHIGLRANLFKRNYCKYHFPIDEELYCNGIPAFKLNIGVLNNPIVHVKVKEESKESSKGKIYYILKLHRIIIRAKYVRERYGIHPLLYIIVEPLIFLYRNLKILKDGGYLGLYGFKNMVKRVLQFLNVSLYSLIYIILYQATISQESHKGL